MTSKTAADYLADAYQGDVPSSKIAEMIREGKGGVVSIDIAKAAISRAIAAEAAAMRERAAGVAMDVAEGAQHLYDKGKNDGDVVAGMIHGEGSRSARAIYHAIRALPATGEVGRG